MLQNTLKNKIVSYNYLNNVLIERNFILNRRNFFNLNKKFHFNLNTGRSENILNSNSHYNFDNSKSILLKKYSTEVNNIEENGKVNQNITENKKEIEEDKEKVDNKIKKEQNSKKKKNNNKNNNKKQKNDWAKVSFAVLSGIGIGYGLNLLINDNNNNNNNNNKNFNNSMNNLVESFKNLSKKDKKIDKFDVTEFHESVNTKINIKEDSLNKDNKNDVTVDIKIEEKQPDKEVSITKINYDSKKDSNNTTITTDKSPEELEKEITNIKNESNALMKNINDTINYIGSFFGFGDKTIESVSEFDKEVEDAYMDIINNINKAPSEIKINNLRNNESININAESVSNEESIKEIEEKLKSWGDEMANEKSKNSVLPENPENTANKADMVISNNVDLKEDNNKIVDFVNDMVKITDDVKSNKKIIKVSAKPIAKAFHEASKISNSLEKNKDNLPEFLADCIKETTNVIKKISNDNDEIQNTFLDTVKIFSDSMNAISDYLDQLEIEIKTELNDNADNDENGNKY